MSPARIFRTHDNPDGRGHPHGACIRDLQSLGYVEEEFLFEGTAATFSLAEGTDYSFDGRWTATARSEVAFLTRFLVCRPVGGRQFSGIVVVNWNNVSAGFDVAYGRSPLVFEVGWA